MTRETAIGLLLRLMDDESEINWASSWAHGHEYMLWACVVGDPSELVRGVASDATYLGQLAAIANGWFARMDELDDVEFVELDRWLEMYAQQRAELEGKARK